MPLTRRSMLAGTVSLSTGLVGCLSDDSRSTPTPSPLRLRSVRLFNLRPEPTTVNLSVARNATTVVHEASHELAADQSSVSSSSSKSSLTVNGWDGLGQYAVRVSVGEASTSIAVWQRHDGDCAVVLVAIRDGPSLAVTAESCESDAPTPPAGDS